MWVHFGRRLPHRRQRGRLSSRRWPRKQVSQRRISITPSCWSPHTGWNFDRSTVPTRDRTGGTDSTHLVRSPTGVTGVPSACNAHHITSDHGAPPCRQPEYCRNRWWKSPAGKAYKQSGGPSWPRLSSGRRLPGREKVEPGGIEPPCRFNETLQRKRFYVGAQSRRCRIRCSRKPHRPS